jgi:PAS domain S-box-containing protein
MSKPRAQRQPQVDERADPRDLREANRQLLQAGLEAGARADAQTSLASALRRLLENRDQEERGVHDELELLRSITDNVSVAVFLVDARAHPIYLNPAAEAMFGFTLSEIQDASMHQAVHHHHPDGRDFPPKDCLINTALHARTMLRDHEDVFVRKDGTFFPARCDVSPLGIGGSQLGAVWEVRDRTREARAEEAKREYVALIAHDLRTPLSALRGHAELLARRLRRDQGSNEDRLLSLDSIVASAQRMEAMIREIIESSHLESGALVLHRSPVHLSQLAAQVAAQVPPEERPRVEVIPAPGGPLVSVDRDRIERVLMNLLQNALKYSAPEAPVRIEVREDAREMVIAVIDRGVGIPAHELPEIFQRFVRAREAQARSDGFGLGLYIARLIVEAHGGRVWAESVVGTGSRIGFALPLDAGTDATGEVRAARSG